MNVGQQAHKCPPMEILSSESLSPWASLPTTTEGGFFLLPFFVLAGRIIKLSGDP